MRRITLIIVHCTANVAGSTLRVSDIDRYHRSLGWNGCGYHYVIPADGAIEKGRPDEMVGAHCLHHNRHSIGVAYVGGLTAEGQPTDTRTPAQRTALRSLLKELKQRYPQALIVGHSDLDPIRKPHCPGFNAVKEYLDIR